MISSLSGVVTEVDAGSIELDVAGVGYRVNVPTGVAAGARTGQKMKLMTQLIVREDSMTIFGFSSTEQRGLFNSLTSVTGVGPKIALAVLSSFDPVDLTQAIATGDVESLRMVPGIGKKAAERVIVELKEKIGEAVSLAPDTTAAEEARDALIGLGYSSGEIRELLPRIASKESTVEQIIREALRELARV